MKLIAALVGVTCLAGCQQFGTPEYNADIRLSDTAIQVMRGNGTLPSGATNVPSDAVIILTAMAGGVGVNDPAVQKAIATALISNSDAACESYMADTVTASNSVSSGLNISNLALTAAAGVATPVESANILSGVATFLAGTRTELSNNVLGGKTPDILYRAVMAVRKEERQRLLTLLDQNAGSPSYVLGQLNDYHSKCGIVVALNALTEAVEDAETLAQAKGSKAAVDESRALMTPIQ